MNKLNIFFIKFPNKLSFDDSGDKNINSLNTGAQKTHFKLSNDEFEIDFSTGSKIIWSNMV